MIRFQSVSYTYPNREIPAISDVTMEINSGEFVVIAGSSGSGKSTVLRTINGLVPHFSGGVIRGEIVVNDLRPLEVGPQVMSRYVGFVSQNPEAQTILEKVEPEIAFALENAAMPRPEMHERVHEVLRYLGLESLRNRAINTLSGGERQRVAIASALALKPELLVLDEPTSQLDPQSAADVLNMLRDLNRELGLTIVLVEHRLERVLPYAESLAYFENGRLVIHDAVRRALAYIPQPPPIVHLARELEWRPLPLTISEAQDFVPLPVAGQLADWPSAKVAASQDAAPLLRVKNLSFTYDKRHKVLDGIDLDLYPGEILVIMGENGSGKSTLLRNIVGLLTPNQGDVQLSGRSVLDVDTVDLARQIAYLPQYPDDLLFAESVAQELAITLQNHEITSPDRVESTLERLDLVEMAEYYPRDLSTGQRQRVALGAITVSQPGVLLLDEPTRGQDGQIKQQLLQIWRKWRASGMGLVIVTHDVELAVQLADRVLLLADGKIEAGGLVREVLAHAPAFAPEIARLFPESGWLTVDDALAGLRQGSVVETTDD